VKPITRQPNPVPKKSPFLSTYEELTWPRKPGNFFRPSEQTSIYSPVKLFMKNLPEHPAVETATVHSDHSVSIFQLVSRLQANLLPQAIQKKSFIINDVDRTISVTADENILAFIVSSLVSNAIFSTSNCCIRVETVNTDDGMQLKVRNNGAFMYSTHMYSLGNIVDAAHKLGGSIGLQSEGSNGLTVVFSIATSKAA
jgi:hypothetical protein